MPVAWAGMAVNLVVDAALSTTTWLLNEKQLPVQVEWPLQSTDVAINTPPITMAQFDLGVTLGTGSFGRVRFVTHKSTGTHWALKMLKKAEVIRLQQVRTCQCRHALDSRCKIVL